MNAHGLTRTTPLGPTERGSLYRGHRHQPNDRILRYVETSDHTFRNASGALCRREHPRMVRLAETDWEDGRYRLEYAIDAQWRSLEEHLGSLEHWSQRLPIIVDLCRTLPTWREGPIHPLGLGLRNVIMVLTGESWHPWLLPCPPLAPRSPTDLFGLDGPALAALAPEVLRGTPADARKLDSYALATLAAHAVGCPVDAGSDDQRITQPARGVLLRADAEHSAIPPYLHRSPQIKLLFRTIRRYRHTVPEARPADGDDLSAALSAATDLLALAEGLRKGPRDHVIEVLSWIGPDQPVAFLRAAELACEVSRAAGDLAQALAALDRAVPQYPTPELRLRRCELLWLLREGRPESEGAADPEGDRLIAEAKALRGYEQGDVTVHVWSAAVHRERGDYVEEGEVLHYAADLATQNLEALALYHECLRQRLKAFPEADGVREIAEHRITTMNAAGFFDSEEADRWRQRFAC